MDSNYRNVGCLLALCLSFVSSLSAEKCEEQFQALREDKRTMPPDNNGSALVVNTDIYLYSMTAVSELNTELSVQMLYRQTWVDKRLERLENCTPFIGNPDHARGIWLPSVHVINRRNIGSISAVAEGATRIRINSGGQATMINRVDIRILCRMEFHKYPLDKQNCPLEIESSNIPIEKLELRWKKKDPITLNETFYLTGYQLTGYPTSATTSECITGNYSKLIVHFQFQREFGSFLLDIYVPGVLFVVTSWASFWVEIPAAPARVTLGMTTMLTLITSEKSVREKLPKMSYVHALDVWNAFCTGFVFASLVEYALVNYIYHKDKRRRPVGMRRVDSSTTVNSLDTDLSSSFGPFASLKTISNSGERRQQSPGISRAISLQDLESGNQLNSPEVDCGPWIFPKLRPQDIANGIDRKCRVLFPIGFLVFNVVYWAVLWV